MPHEASARGDRGRSKDASLSGGKSDSASTTETTRAEGPPRPGRRESRLEAALAVDTMLVRVVGLGSVNNAGTLWDFALQSIKNDKCRFAVDLSECTGLDSTFLGTLVGLAQEASERAGDDAWVCILNACDANRELFEIVGADRYVRFKPSVVMEPIETVPLTAEAQTLEKRLALVRRAHENLVGIDRRNEARFGEFLRCLAEELAKG